MTAASYNSPAGRINTILGETLAHAIPVEVLSSGFSMKQAPMNKGQVIKYRRWLPYGATATNANTQNRWSVSAPAHRLTEGTTPSADSITPVDVTATLQEYGALYAYTNAVAETYEDNVPDAEKVQLGQRIGLVREMIRYGEAKSCTNIYYQGGTSRATVDEVISITKLRHIAKNLMANHAAMKTRYLSSSPDFETFALSAGYVVFGHTDMEPDIRDLPGFIDKKDYGTNGGGVVSQYEIGSVERFRFILSPELAPVIDAGGAIAGTDLYSTGGTYADVYPLIIMAEDAAFDIALRGMDSMKVYTNDINQQDKSDPLCQRGYIGARFWSAAKIVNDGWMAVLETAITDTSS